MNTLENKKLTASERWTLLGHLLFSAGTLCLSIASLWKLAQDGNLPDIAPGVARTSSSITSSRDQAYDFFRRS